MENAPKAGRSWTMTLLPILVAGGLVFALVSAYVEWSAA
jgi:hypothetical protein